VDADVKFEENSSTDQHPNLSHGLGDDKTCTFLLAISMMSGVVDTSCRG